MKVLADKILDIIFPTFCLNCNNEGAYICKECSLFVSENSLVCPLCVESSYTGKTHQRCKNRYAVDGVVSVWDYDRVIKNCIHELKYHDVYHIAKELTERALIVMIKDKERFSDFLQFIANDDVVITFVPAHCSRFFLPTYNNKQKNKKGFFAVPSEKRHAQIIAKELANALGRKEEVLLKKIKKTQRQAKLNKEERAKNVKNSFIVDKKEVPQRVVLVDDVFTTGATIRECGKVLKRSGVREVWGFTVVRTV